jgi:hypothetical protein
MRPMMTLGVACAAMVASFAATVPASAKSSCVRAGGEATMITEDLARFMASAALKNSIAGMGAKPSGAVAMKCTPGALTYCIAHQRACK